MKKVNVIMYPMWYVICIITVFLRILCGFTLYLLNTEIRRGYSLVRISAACIYIRLILVQQLSQRLEQVTFWPWQYCQWRMTMNKKSMMAQARYIGFYNLFWLIGNDLILGFTISKAMQGNESVCHYYFSTFINVSVPDLSNKSMLLVT